MARDLTEMQSDLDELRRAAASGALMIRHGEKSVTYRSMADLQVAISNLQTEIAGLSGTSRRKQIRLRYRRGTEAA